MRARLRGRRVAAEAATPPTAAEARHADTWYPADEPDYVSPLAVRPPGQHRAVRMSMDDVLAARGVTGYLAGFRQRLSDDADRDPRPELAGRAGYLGDVVFPELDA